LTELDVEIVYLYVLHTQNIAVIVQQTIYSSLTIPWHTDSPARRPHSWAVVSGQACPLAATTLRCQKIIISPCRTDIRFYYQSE